MLDGRLGHTPTRLTSIKLIGRNIIATKIKLHTKDSVKMQMWCYLMPWMRMRYTQVYMAWPWLD